MSVSPPRNGERPAVQAPASPETDPRLTCPRCGTAHKPNQEYCLECGLRLPVEATGLVPRLSRAWRRRVDWYPGDWIWPSLLALVIATLAGAGAAAFVARDTNRTTYVTATSPADTSTSPITPPERTTATTATTPTSTRAQPQPPPPPAAQALTTWPAGRSGYTVVLQSLPTAGGRAFALAQARAALHSGLTQVGILDSSRYSSLHPGYYVLFTGIDSSFDDANTRATTARSHGYPRAYPRRITP